MSREKSLIICGIDDYIDIKDKDIEKSGDFTLEIDPLNSLLFKEKNRKKSAR